MTESVQYTLTVSEKQLALIGAALESYARLRMGQYHDYADEIAENGYVYDKSNPDNDRLFDAYIKRRNDAKELLEKAYNVAAPDVYKRTKSLNVQNAIDIWHVIRYQFYLNRKAEPDFVEHYTVDSYPPSPFGDEQLPKLEKIKEMQK